MKVLARGSTEVVDVPDQPTAPTVTGATLARGPEVPAGAQDTSDHEVSTRAETTSAPVITATSDPAPSMPITVSFANAPALLTVPSAVTDIQLPAMAHGDLAATGGTGSGELARGSDELASLSLDGPGYADHGWFIVPSASNEYGAAYAAADDFSFDVAAGEFSSDWFWV